MGDSWAQFAGVRAKDVVQYADLREEPHVLADGGWWAVAAEFDGPWHAWRFADVRIEHTERAQHTEHTEIPQRPRVWAGPARDSWSSSMSRANYLAAVQEIRNRIESGEVYQVNVCRVLSADVPQRPDAAALSAILTSGNPAPYAGVIDVQADDDGAIPGAWVVSASPELSVAVADGLVSSGPIKGTAPSAEQLLDKDRAENVMITDLVRNDLQHVCAPGTVTVTDLLAVEEHPGLVHLVSRVRGELANPDLAADGARGWQELLAATHPPGSISGAPKSSALTAIADTEPTNRGPYCGQIGWIDADAGTARLAVGIRTFWWSDARLNFGTGAGITYDSDPASEWAETELKAATLLNLASTSGKVDA